MSINRYAIYIDKNSEQILYVPTSPNIVEKIVKIIKLYASEEGRNIASDDVPINDMVKNDIKIKYNAGNKIPFSIFFL